MTKGIWAVLPVKQCQQAEPVKVQANPQARQKPQAVVLPVLASGSSIHRVILSQWCILELWAQISILLLQQLWIHRQKTI